MILSKQLETITRPGYANEPLGVHDDTGKLRIKRFDVEIKTEDKEIGLVRLPNGHKNILGAMSLIQVDLGVDDATAKEKIKDITFDCGVPAHRKLTGERLDSDSKCLDEAQPLKLINRICSESPGFTEYLGTYDSLDLFITLSKPLPVGTKLHGYIIYVKD